MAGVHCCFGLSSDFHRTLLNVVDGISNWSGRISLRMNDRIDDVKTFPSLYYHFSFLRIFIHFQINTNCLSKRFHSSYCLVFIIKIHEIEVLRG